MGDELSRRQAQNGVNFDFEVKFDLEGQGQSPPKTIGILTKVFYTYGPNLVILAWTGDELSRGQTWWRTDGLTDGPTDAGNDNTRRPILASGNKMDLASIVEDTKWTWFCPMMDKQMDGWTWNQYTPFQRRWSRGYDNYINGLIQKRCNSIAYALELCLSCIKPFR